MRHGQKHFCYTGNFCGKRCCSKQQKRKRDFLRRSKKSVFFFFERGISKKKNKFETWWKNFFSLQMSNDRISENIFLEGFKQVLCQKKKVAFILFERTRLKNQHKKKSETKKKEIEQKKVLQKGMNKWKRSFFKKMKNKGFFFFKKVSQKKKKLKKHKRESINTRRRNMERSTAKMHGEKMK